jgi:hypothetical protein
MSLSIPTLFLLYVAVFLAVIFIAWLIFAWRRRKIRYNSRKVLVCPGCGGKNQYRNEAIFIRCSHCGAKVKLSKFFEKD